MVNAANPYEPPAELESQRSRLPWSKRMMLAVLVAVCLPSTVLFGVTAGLIVGVPLAAICGKSVAVTAGAITAAIAMMWTIYQYAAVIRRISKQ
jgi:hypothetical protein